MSKEEQAAYNVMISSGKPGVALQAAQNLMAWHQTQAQVDIAETPSGSGFKSSAEMQAAISDSRYKSDPAYRQMVANKIANSPNNLF